MTPARADRRLTAGLALVLGLALAAASAATLAGCETPTPTGEAHWAPVEPPPGSPPGTACWVWRSQSFPPDARYGGPHCTAPLAPCVEGGAQ